MTKKLVLIGGGHAHVQTIDRLGSFIEKNHTVTVIQPSKYHYYSGMGPGMLGGTYKAEEIRFATRRMVEAAGGRFINDKVVRIDPVKQCLYLACSSEEVHYDVLSCNVGSYVPDSNLFTSSSTIYRAKPIEALYEARNSILDTLKEGRITVAVVGGGPSAAEIAGNVHQLCKGATHNAEILLFGGGDFFGKKPRKVRKAVRKILQQKGVKIIEGERVQSVDDGKITTDSGTEYSADIVFCAIGVKPSPLFNDSGMSTGISGGLLVNRLLQSIDYPNIFGGGDCVDFEPEPLNKVGVYAVRQNEVLLHNLMATLEEKSCTIFKPGGEYLLIYNLGSGDGVLSKWSFTVAGSLAFRVKDYIDRSFIRTYQK